MASSDLVIRRPKMIKCDNLVKIFKTSEIEVVALQGLDLTVEDGELMAIIGNSGSGKSTLLNILGGLDRPSAGSLIINGIDMLKLNRHQMEDYRKLQVGFMWQNSGRNLVPYLSALENVELPMILSGKLDRNHALELLELTGMSHRRNSRLMELSGGEQQRVAMAIALANSPKILLADEPTGAVDTRTADMVLDAFREINRRLGVTIIIVTHDLLLAKKVNRIVSIRDGRTSSEILRRTVSIREELEKETQELKADAEPAEQEEFIIMDRSGRIQIPQRFIEEIGLNGKSKIKAEVIDKTIVLHLPEESVV